MDAELVYVRELCKKKLGYGKSLLELTTYDDIAMWWTKDIPLYRFIKRVVNGDISDKSIHPKIFMTLYKTIRRHINFLFYIELLYDLLLNVLVRVMIRILGRRNQDLKKNKPKIMFVATDSEWRDVRDYKTNKLKKGDAIFDSVITRLKDRYNLVGVYPIDHSPVKGVGVFRDKLRNWDVTHKPLSLYWSLDVWNKEKEAFREFKKSWNCLVEDDVFRKMCVYKGKDLYNQIIGELELYFLFLFPRTVKYIEMGKQMIKSEKPDLILLQDEYGLEKSYLVIPAKLENIPTLALQHGVIESTHEGYIYAKDEISPEGSIESPYCPIPDKTAVYGTYHKDLLTKVSAYPRDSVVVTGQPRYDILYHADNVYSKEKLLKKYGINPKHKIILWITQCHGLSNNENFEYFKTVFGTVQNIKDTTLVIKQHPGEGEKHTKMIKDHLKNYKINAIVTPKTSDTYEQLFVCDLMITIESTTAMEAVALNKAVIILDLRMEPRIIDYVKEGVALGVYKKENLKPAIEKLLRDDSILVKNRGGYIRKYLYKVDGNAAERVVNLIEEMTKKEEG